MINMPQLKGKVLIPVVLLCLFVAIQANTHAQTAGCTDPRAINFNPAASVNDGSCIYSTTVNNPPFISELPEAVKETSGLLVFRGKIWTFNDSGGAAVLYALDTSTFQVVQQISLSGATNVDWEDIAMDDTYIYVADIGNNNGNRDDLTIYRIYQSSIPINGNASVNTTKIHFTYEDQKELLHSKNHNFDCEAIVAVEDSLFLFTKNRADQQCNLYVLPSESGTFVARKKANFNTNGLITGADLQRESKQVFLTGYTQRTYVPFVWILFDFQGNDFFGGNKRRIELANLFTTQIEGVAYHGPFSCFVSAEESQTFSARLFRMNTATWTGFTGLDEAGEESSSGKLRVVENPVRSHDLKLFVGFQKGDYRLDIYDSTGRIVKQLNLIQTEPETLSINLEGFKAGTYYVRAFTQRKEYHSAFILP